MNQGRNRGKSITLSRRDKELLLLIFFGLLIWCAIFGFFVQQDLLPANTILNKTSLLFQLVPDHDIQQIILRSNTDDSDSVTQLRDKEQKMTEDFLIGPKLQAIKKMNQCEEICKAKKIYLLNVVHSAAEHIEHRMMIRETWGDIKSYKNIHIETVFIIGIPRRANIIEDIDEEKSDFGDIVQGDFVDVEENRLLKHFLGLQWVSEKCAFARFVLTVEDNVVVNMLNLLRYLSIKNQERHLIHCAYVYSSIEIPIHITNGNKIFTINYGRSKHTYPSFCMATAYVTSATSIKLLYEAGLKSSKTLLFDDVFITGILANNSKIPRKDISVQYHWQLFNDKTTMTELKKLIFIQMPQYWYFNRIRPIWSKIWTKMEAWVYNANK